MADPGAVDWLQAAARASEAGLAGRSACVLFDGARFEWPFSAGASRPLPGIRLQSLSGRDAEALVITPGETDEGIPDPAAAVRMLVKLGVERLLILADAEPLHDGLQRLATVRDHVNLGAPNPLVGANDDRFGPRFPDMSEAYDRDLRTRLDAAAGLEPGGIVLAATARGGADGIAAEAATWGTLGVDAVTDGVVPTVIAARHAGIRIAAAVAIGPVPVDETRILVDAFLEGV